MITRIGYNLFLNQNSELENIISVRRFFIGVFIWRNLVEIIIIFLGENFVLVLVSEQSYTSNKYLNYKKTVMEILDKYSISRTNLKEIELHSINGVGGNNKGNCGCNKNKSTKDVVTISKEDNEEQNICTEITALSKDQEYASKVCVSLLLTCFIPYL